MSPLGFLCGHQSAAESALFSSLSADHFSATAPAGCVHIPGIPAILAVDSALPAQSTCPRADRVC